MLFTDWEVRIGRNCARGLEYRPLLFFPRYPATSLQSLLHPLKMTGQPQNTLQRHSLWDYRYGMLLLINCYTCNMFRLEFHWIIFEV